MARNRTGMFLRNTPEPFTARRWLVALVLMALVARLGWGLTRPVDEAAMARSLPDQREYLELGRGLLAGEGLRLTDLRFGDTVRAYRTPGYPLLVAAGGGNVRAIRAVQAVLDASTVLATFVLARRWLGAGLSLLAAGAVAVNPFLIFFSSLILTETLFTAMLAWGTALLALGGQAGRSRRLVYGWAGLAMLALSVQVRPGAIGLPLAMGLAAALAADRGMAWGPGRGFWRVPAGAAALALLAAVLLPWAARNRLVVGAWVWTSTNSGFTLYDGFNPDADGSSDQSFVRRLPQLSVMGEVPRSKYLSDQAVAWAMEHPARVVGLTGVKLARTWSPVPLSAEYGGRRVYVVVAAAYAGPLLVLAVAGVVRRGGRVPAAGRVFLLMPAIYFSAGVALSVGSLRYRVPAEPMLAVLAASALVGVNRRGDAPERESQV